MLPVSSEIYYPSEYGNCLVIKELLQRKMPLFPTIPLITGVSELDRGENSLHIRAKL